VAVCRSVSVGGENLQQQREYAYRQPGVFDTVVFLGGEPDTAYQPAEKLETEEGFATTHEVRRCDA
jgi:hypothetical protein